jgi:hypothetical protein
VAVAVQAGLVDRATGPDWSRATLRGSSGLGQSRPRRRGILKLKSRSDKAGRPHVDDSSGEERSANLENTVKSLTPGVLPICVLSVLCLLGASSAPCSAAASPVGKVRIEAAADLARALATHGWVSGGKAAKQRAAAIDWAKEHPESVKWMLRWTEAPPSGINRLDLDRGLIGAFGSLKVEKAIPFLIRQINFRSPVAVWGSGAQTIVELSPAIKALLQIGKPASVPLIRAYSQPLTPEDRLAIVFTLAQLQDQTAKDFLMQVRRHACAEAYRAGQGLKLLGNNPSPAASCELSTAP